MVNNTADLFEMLVLCATLAVVSIARNVLGDIKCPTGITGKPLPGGDTKQEKRARHVDYLLESLIFSSILTVVAVLIVAFSVAASETLVLDFFSFHVI